MRSEESKLMPFLGQMVTLHVITSFFSLTLFGKLVELVGTSQADRWIGIEHDETLKFLEIDWGRLTVENIFTDGPEYPAIFVVERHSL